MLNNLKTIREKVRGIEHLLLGVISSAAGFAVTLMEHLQGQDLSPLLQKYLPSGWTPAEVMCGMGVAIILLHTLVADKRKDKDGEK